MPESDTKGGLEYEENVVVTLLVVVLIVGILGTAYLFLQRSLDAAYFNSLPKSLKDGSGKLHIHKKLVKHIEAQKNELLLSAHSKFLSDRGPARTLENPEVSAYVEKFAHVYFDDFNNDISSGKLYLHQENTKLFFELMEHKFKITNRALLKTLLYLRHEIGYFNYRNSVGLMKPDNFKTLLKQSIKYRTTNELAYLDMFFIKRAACEFGIKLPLFMADQKLIQRTKKELELEQFDKAFSANNKKITENSQQRLTRVSWEEFLAIASSEGINISESEYIVLPEDYSRDSRVDRFFKNHLKFILVQHFDGKCVDCGALSDLELDHFWRPKSTGGNFAMRSRQHFYVNNCIPLCRSCNASKGARSIFEYFDSDKVKALLKTSHSFGSTLNTFLQKFDDDNFNEIALQATQNSTSQAIEKKKAA